MIIRNGDKRMEIEGVQIKGTFDAQRFLTH